MQRKVDFLFGAGMSMDSNVPSGAELARRLLRLFFPETGASPPSDDRIKELVQDIPFELLVEAVEASRGGRADLTEDLTGILLHPDYPLSQAHHDLLSICTWGGSPPVVDRIFTTNFDSLLDIAFGGSGKRITQANTRDIAEAQRNGRVPILYLHGRLEESKYQITEADVFDTSFKPLQMAFRTALNESDAFVFVGYSMNDPDFRRLYREYRDEIKSRPEYDKRTYVVTPAGADRYGYSLGRRLCEVRGAIWLPFTAKEFFAQLKNILQTKGDKMVQQSIMKKCGLKTTEEYQDKVSQTSEILNVTENDAICFLAEALTETGK